MTSLKFNHSLKLVKKTDEVKQAPEVAKKVDWKSVLFQEARNTYAAENNTIKFDPMPKENIQKKIDFFYINQDYM